MHASHPAGPGSNLTQQKGIFQVKQSLQAVEKREVPVQKVPREAEEAAE